MQQGSDFCLTGKIISTEYSEYDFGNWKPVLQLWNKEDGFGQTFIADKDINAITLMAEAMSSDANLRLHVYSKEPVVHFYTGKWIPRVKGKNGFDYGPFSGYCFETYQYSNAVNIPAFPNTILRPGKIYRQTTIYQF